MLANRTASSSETIERNTESEFRDSRIPVGLSLSENLGPLPRSLVDTLAPNVPVLDQESYLAKYAIDVRMNKWPLVDLFLEFRE